MNAEIWMLITAGCFALLFIVVLVLGGIYAEHLRNKNDKSN